MPLLLRASDYLLQTVVVAPITVALVTFVHRQCQC